MRTGIGTTGAAGVAFAAVLLVVSTPAAAQVTISVSTVNPSNCVLPQGTIDLFNVTVTNGDTTNAATLLDLRIDINNGPDGVGVVDIDSIHIRAQNASNAAGETIVASGLVTSLTGLRIIFNTDNVVPASTSRTYIVGITMSDTAAFGDDFQAQIPAGAVLVVDTAGFPSSVTLGAAVTTNVIEVCGLYADDALPGQSPDATPFIVGAASGDVPIIGLRIAVPKAATALGDEGYQLRRVVLRFIDTGETMNFRPGHPNVAPATEFGDLENIRIWRDADGDGRFDPAVDDRLFNRSRRKLGCGVSIDDDDPNDNASQTFEFDSQTYKLTWNISQTNSNAIITPTSIALAQQLNTRRFNHWISFRTNNANAYGDQPAPDDSCGPGGFVGHGDEWRMQLESITITERRFADQFGIPRQTRDLVIRFTVPENAAPGDTPPRGSVVSDTVNEIMTNPRITTLRADSAVYAVTGGATLDHYFDLSPSGQLERRDGVDLDWLGQVVGMIWAVGSPASFSTNEKLHGVNIVFIGGGGFDPTDLRGISGSTADGIQIWRNTNGNDGLEEGIDVPLPLDPNNSVWVQLNATTWVFRARLATPDVLNQGTYGQGLTSSTFGANALAGDSGSGMRMSVTASGVHPDYWIVAVPSMSADANDSALVFIDDGSIVGEAGVIFTSGVSNRLRGSSSVSAGGIEAGLIVWNVPTIWTDFTIPGQTIQQLSPPTPVLGIDMRDGNPNAGGDQRIGLQSMSIYFLDEGTNPPQLNQSDFLPITTETETLPGKPNPISRSGVAVYKDNKGHPLNTRGVFDPGIDTLVPLAEIDDPAPPDTGTGWHTPGAVANALRIDLIFDSTSAETQVPNDNAGPNLGPDFFIVLRTSNSISGNDRFRVVVGDLNTNDGIRSFVRLNNHALPANLFGVMGSVFADTPNPTVPFRQDVFSPFQGATMRTEQITVNTLTSATVQNAVPAGFTVDRDERFAAFGINMLDGTANPVTLEQVLVDVFDAGGNSFSTADLATILGSSATSGVALFADTGAVGTTKGVFGAEDIHIPATITQSVITAPFGGTARRYTITPLQSIQVPDDDTTPANVGNDLFVVLRTSNTITFADSFLARIPDTGVIFSAASFNSNKAETSNLVTANVPTAITDSTVSGDTVVPGVRKVVFGINANDVKNDGTDGAVFLASVDAVLEGVSNFQLADIFASLTFPQNGDSSTGLALFKDNGSGAVGFFDSTDGNIPVRIENLGGPPFRIRLVVTGGDSAVPTGDAGADTGPDFFLIVNVSNTAQNGDQFRVAIPIGGIQYTAGSPKNVSDTSEILTVAGAAGSAQLTPRSVIAPDSNGIADTTGIRVALAFDTSYHLRVVRTVTGVQVSPNAFPFQARDDDTTIPIGSGTTLDSPTLVAGFYTIAVDFATTPAGDTSTDTFATELAVDLLADTPSVEVTSVSGTQVTITARHKLDDCPQSSDSIARDRCLANEHAERTVGASTLEIFADGVLVDSITIPVGQSSASKTITLPSGIVTLTGQCTDAVGNRTATPFAIGAPINTLSTGALNVSFEGNSPVFYLSPSNPEFTFTFPGRTTGAPFIEIYNLAGNRLRRIPIPTGVTSVNWDGRNDAGQLMRNGVYLLKFHVPLEGGVAIEERRTIVLMK